jgi:hypothetical protein
MAVSRVNVGTALVLYVAEILNFLG